MAIIYKMDVIKELKRRGYSTYILRKNKMLAESTLQKLRTWTLPSWKEVDQLCKLLRAQPGDLLGYISDTDRDHIMKKINDRIAELEYYVNDELWPQVGDDITYPIGEKMWEDFQDYLRYTLEETDPELAAIFHDIIDERLHHGHDSLSEEVCDHLKESHKASVVNKAKKMIDDYIETYEASYDKAYNNYKSEFVKNQIKEEAPDLIGKVNFQTSYKVE